MSDLHFYSLKRGNPPLLILKALGKENFSRWLICHTTFTQRKVTLFKNLADDIGFIIKPFIKNADENHSGEKNRTLSFSFSVAAIGHNLHCFGRKGFSKDASSRVFLNYSKSIFDLEVYLSKSKIWVTLHRTGTLWPSCQDQYYF